MGFLIDSPGYFVHTWNVTLGATVPMGYVSSLRSLILALLAMWPEEMVGLMQFK